MIMSIVGNFKKDSMRTIINEIYGHENPKLVQYQENSKWGTGFDIIPEKVTGPSNIYFRFYGGEEIILQMFYEFPIAWHDVHFVIADEILSKERSNIVNLLKGKYPGIEQSLKLDILSSPQSNHLKISVVARDRDQLTLLSNDLNQVLYNIDFKIPPESLDYLRIKSKTAFYQNIEKPHMFGIYNANVLAERGIEAVLLSWDKEIYQQAAADVAGYKIEKKPLVLIQLPNTKSKIQESDKTSEAKKYVDPESDLVLIAAQNASSELVAIHFLLKYKAQYDSRFGGDAAKILHDCFGERMQSVEAQKVSNQFGLSFTVNDNPSIPMDDIYLNPDFGYIRVEGLADDIGGIINYLKNQFAGFVPTEEEYKKALAKTKMPMMGMGSSESSIIFEKAWEKQVYEEEKYPVNQMVISYDELVKMAAHYFHPSNMIISVVSPASSEEILRLFEWHIPLPADRNYIEKKPYIRNLKINNSEYSVELKGGGERSFLFWGFVKQFERNDLAALQVLGLLLNDSIIFEIREKQGRAYRMKAGIDLIGEKALFYINLGTRPDNIDPVIQQAPEFFDQKTVDSFTDFDLQKSLNMYLGRMMFRRLSSINRAFYLGYSEYFESDIDFDSKFLKNLRKITLSDIKRTAEKYMVIKNPVKVIVR
jgi:hypothetical protein